MSKINVIIISFKSYIKIFIRIVLYLILVFLSLNFNIYNEKIFVMIDHINYTNNDKIYCKNEFS